MYRDIPEELKVLIEPIVEDAGFELVDIVQNRGRRPWLLRCVVDTQAGDGRVPVDHCAAISREIETHLDTADAISAPYQLEVSSPGLDRVLAREKDFHAACGREVKLETNRAVPGRKRFRGRLLSFDGATLRLDVDGDEVAIAFGDVVKANSIYEFTRDDFVGRAGLQ